MKLIVACDGRGTAALLTVVARCAALAGSEVLFAHVVDPSIEEQWSPMAGHHWLRRHPGPRERARFEEAATRSAQELLGEALALSATWPVALRRAVAVEGNPERELVRLALAEGADLLAVGQHHRELGPHALGHCARFVVDHAPCPVLVVRDDALRAEGAALLGNRLMHGPKGAPHHRPRA
jgi:nucleotide-binding universal stress UspA family protein